MKKSRWGWGEWLQAIATGVNPRGTHVNVNHVGIGDVVDVPARGENPVWDVSNDTWASPDGDCPVEYDDGSWRFVRPGILFIFRADMLGGSSWDPSSESRRVFESEVYLAAHQTGQDVVMRERRPRGVRLEGVRLEFEQRLKAEIEELERRAEEARKMLASSRRD